MTRAALVVVVALVALTSVASAHELRPAYLELRETAPGEYDVLWKTPMVGEARLDLVPEFPEGSRATSPMATRKPPGAAVQTWTLRAPGLRGGALRIRGLDSTMTDVIVRVAHADGTSWTKRLTPQQPSATVPQAQGRGEVFVGFLGLGVEHILFGPDHLLFVLGLLLLVDGRGMLLKTVTAFTVAHSITLAVATLGLASAPAAPLNAAIALSILFLGPEIVRKWRGGTSLTLRHPWVVAFAFGLLHGFGFSAALSDTGLPRADLPWALLAFNVGVEVGQVAFIALVLALLRSFRQLELVWPRFATRIPGYAIGTLGAYFVIDRTVALLGGLA
ncbi:MAG: HupE/UreJ family protein [Planctomycetota bacterium]